MGKRGNELVDSVPDLPCQIYDIGDHGATGGSPPRTEPVIEVGPHKIAFQVYSIIDSVNTCHNMV